MLLFFDTETTDLPLFKSPSEDPRQPHLIQVAALLTDDDGEEIERLSTIVALPEGVEVAPEAFAAHGITPARSRAEGRDALEVLGELFAMRDKAEIDVAHNRQFDARIARIQALRYGLFDPFEKGRSECSLTLSTPILNLPPTPKMVAAGFKKPKSPNLGECVEFFFGEKHDKAHDALADVIACKRVYFAIKQGRGKWEGEPA